MAHESLTCAEGIAPERLSALRDAALAPAEAEQMRAHIATCPACRARMADYDALATALRQQRELEPGERILTGVRARLATRQTSPRLRPSRRVWTGMATLAPVAAIILLFVYVFSGLAGRARPATANTPTVALPTPIATNQFGKPIYPTVTPAHVTLPPMTPSVSAATAWGPFSPATTVQTPSAANTLFSFDALSPDATTLIGTELTHADPGSGREDVYLISYDIASHTYRRLGPQWTGYGAPWGGAAGVSARYIAYGFNSQPGATCGVCNNSLWTYDRQTGASWKIDPGAQYSGALGDIVSGDHVAFTSIEEQVWVADPATRQVALALPVGAQPASTTAPTTTPQAGVRLDGFVWPNLIYEYSPPQTNPNTPVVTSLRITNLQTHVTTIVSPSLSETLGFQNSASMSSGVSWATLSGDTLYIGASTNANGVDQRGATVQATFGTVYRITHVFSGANAGQPETLARWTGVDLSGAGTLNSRLILLGGGFVWDIAEGKLVQLPSTSAANQTQTASLSGSYLMLTHTVNTSDPQTPTTVGAIYDTATLPVR
ncbi:MAG TPA: zf-HC2 domain-containing protein [Ktedonobacterales bacterium]|nr:zf-HC2 domain-containing protein [Ktedonobacterales bacterium]